MDSRGCDWERHMPGDPQKCRSNAARYLRLAERAITPARRQQFSALADIWKKLAAEAESDEVLLRTLSELEFSEPHEALPQALNLRSRAA
jgi:hypothetical protein